MAVFDHITDADRPLVVTDTETTGTSASNCRIIEIGAIRIDPDGTRTAFEQLIDPGFSLPHRITRITGITTSMLVGRPTAAEVLPEFLSFLGEGVLVAHNLRFDESFLNAELERAELPTLRNPALCSLKLARRLLPGLRSKSLASLAKFYKIPSHGRHRALRDVEITVDVLERLLRIADTDHGIRSLGELLDLQSRTYARVNPLSRHVDRIRNEVLPGLPDEPGVYRMTGGRGEVLYIGKAKTLSSRVRSYFTAVEAHPPRIRELIGRVRDVEWVTFDTELEALIEESRLIKAESPSFNRALTRFTPRPFLRLDSSDDYPRLTAQVICRDDGAEYFGPIRSRGEARALLDICERHFPIRNCDQVRFERGKRCMRADIGRCPAPCELAGIAESAGRAEGGDAHETVRTVYDEAVRNLRAFLGGDIAEVAMQIADDMERASSDLNFEHAATFRDWLALLDRLVERTGTVAPAVEGPDRLVVRNGNSEATVVLIRRGTVVGIESLARPEDTDAVAACIGSLFSEDIEPAPGLDRTSADARRIVDQWIGRYRASIMEYERRADESFSVFAARVAAGLRPATAAAGSSGAESTGVESSGAAPSRAAAAGSADSSTIR